MEAVSLYKTNTVIKVNPMENMWSEVKRTMQETWPVLPSRNSNELSNPICIDMAVRNITIFCNIQGVSVLRPDAPLGTIKATPPPAATGYILE